MMWVIRAGQNSVYYDKFLEESKVFLPWTGFKMDLSSFSSRPEFRNLVEKEKGDVHHTSVSNWAGQLYSFTVDAQKNDFVLIPSKGSHTYCLSKITGDYAFNENEPSKLYHSRDIKVILKDIPKRIFSQEIVYSLGAFRTIFKARHEEEIIRAIKKWKDKKHETAI